MAIELNHTIVPARDPGASARFLADILGLAVDPPVSHFTPVTLANHLTLDYGDPHPGPLTRGGHLRKPWAYGTAGRPKTAWALRPVAGMLADVEPQGS